MPLSLSERDYSVCYKNNWMVKYFYLCIEGLYQLWLEWCNIIDEVTMSKVRIENIHTLLTQVRILYRVIDKGSSSALWRHKEKVTSLSTATIRGIIYEKNYFAGGECAHERFNDFIRSSCKHKSMSLSEELLELRNETTRNRHLFRKRKQECR